MTREEARNTARDMERNGFNVSLRRYGNSYAVDATDSATGISITINTVEQWEERKQAIAFSREYDA
jgi:hypothetical protein